MLWRKKKPDPTQAALAVVTKACSDFKEGLAAVAKIIDVVVQNNDRVLSHIARVQTRAMHEVILAARTAVAAQSLRDGDPITSRTVAGAMAYGVPYTTDLFPSDNDAADNEAGSAPNDAGVEPQYPSEPPRYADEELVGAEPGPPPMGKPAKPDTTP